MQILSSNLPEIFFDFIYSQAFGVSGAAILIFFILTFIVFPILVKVYISMKNKANKGFVGTVLVFLITVWLLSASSILGPIFFVGINYACTSYEATSCFLISVVAVVIGFMGMSYMKKETEKISILENALIKEEDYNKSNDGIAISLYE